MNIHRYIYIKRCVCVCVCEYIHSYINIIIHIHIHIQIHMQYICTSVHTPQRSYAQLYLTRGRPQGRAARAESGAYVGQRGDRRGVPRADVRVERRRREERLRAEPPAVDADGNALERVGADVRAPDRTRTRARTDAHVGRVRTPMPTSHSSTHIRICIKYTYMYIM